MAAAALRVGAAFEGEGGDFVKFVSALEGAADGAAVAVNEDADFGGEAVANLFQFGTVLFGRTLQRPRQTFPFHLADFHPAGLNFMNIFTGYICWHEASPVRKKRPGLGDGGMKRRRVIPGRVVIDDFVSRLDFIGEGGKGANVREEAGRG